MSGGAYNYAEYPVKSMAEKLRGKDRDPLRRAFADHLLKVAEAIHQVEWVDSGDYSDGDEDAIRAVLAPGVELEAATQMAREALINLTEALKRASPR